MNVRDYYKRLIQELDHDLFHEKLLVEEPDEIVTNILSELGRSSFISTFSFVEVMAI